MSFGMLAVAGGLLAGDATAAPAGGAESDSVLIAQDFAAPTAASTFTLVCGGAWTSGGYVYTLTHAVTSSACVGNANLVVADPPVSGNWQLSVRMSAKPTLSGRDGFSVVFGFQDPSHYLYANFSQSQAAGSDGVFQVAGTTITELASFAGVSPPLMPRRNYDITLMATGSTVEIADDGILLAGVLTPQLAGRTRVGLGSQGSDVTARQFTVAGRHRDRVLHALDWRLGAGDQPGQLQRGQQPTDLLRLRQLLRGAPLLLRPLHDHHRLGADRAGARLHLPDRLHLR